MAKDKTKKELKKVKDEMTFIEHLEELRWHLVRSLSAIMIIFIVLFLFKNFVFNYIVLAPKNEGFLSYRVACAFSDWVGLGDMLCFSPYSFEIINVELGEKFMSHIKVSFILAIVIGFPYIFYEFWKFVKPGLYKNEQKAVRGIVWICSFLFYLGISFGYFVIAPFAINFLAGYDLSEVVTKVSITSFVSFLIMFTAPAGLVFELPIVVYFLSKLGIVTPEFMKKYRRHAMLLILIVAAVITPPDVVSQFLIAIPLYILYEISIVISKRAYKSYQKSLE